MKFGPAEMAQMMYAAKALITVMIVSSVGIGLVLGAIVAFFQHRERVTPDPGDLMLERRAISSRNTRATLSPSTITLNILLLIAAVGGGVLYWHYTSQRLDIPQRADASERSHAPQRPHDTEIYSTLGIPSLPEEVAVSGPIRHPIEQLSRERCDQQAIFDLATALQSAGYKREAANVLVSFSRTCGGYAPVLR
jgi:hypothetical protein